MGGLLSGRFAQRWPAEVAGIGFCGSVIGDWQWAREALAQPELPRYEFNPLDNSRDPAAGVSYAQDPLVYHGQYKRPLLEAEVVALDKFADEINELTMPVAVFHGTEDPFVPYERSVKAVGDMPSDDVEIHLYEGARHEVLNETNRDEVIADLAAWIERVAPSR
jgi:alpha-beta hydrolase superfamily lysophospholipase